MRTRYAFGLLPDYIQTSTEVTMDWRYIAATNEIMFDGVGSLDLGESSYEGWEANPVVSICLGAVVVPESPSAVLLALSTPSSGS